MSLLLFLATAVSTDGPDLAAIDRAVAKCDARIMTATFADEPQRRRANAIAIFDEQQEIVAARRALAAKRLAPAPSVTPPPAITSPAAAADHAEIDRETELLNERQQALDDARMLSVMREHALDMMRQQYVSKCSGGRP